MQPYGLVVIVVGLRETFNGKSKSKLDQLRQSGTWYLV
jgi:hypothetical protein